MDGGPTGGSAGEGTSAGASGLEIEGAGDGGAASKEVSDLPAAAVARVAGAARAAGGEAAASW